MGEGAGGRVERSLFFTTGDPEAMRRAAACAFGNRLETIECWVEHRDAR
jgi:hypothetical protein